MIKTITFAIMHFTVAFTIAYLLTGDVLVGGLIAMVEPAVNTVAFYFHERIWKSIEAKHQANNTYNFAHLFAWIRHQPHHLGR